MFFLCEVLEEVFAQVFGIGWGYAFGYFDVAELVLGWDAHCVVPGFEAGALVEFGTPTLWKSIVFAIAHFADDGAEVSFLNRPNPLAYTWLHHPPVAQFKNSFSYDIKR